MNKIVISLLIAASIIIHGCISVNNPISSDLWEELQPEGDFFPSANKVRIWLDSKANRANTIKYVGNQLRCRRLSLNDQLRLGLVVNIMAMSAEKNEIDSICKLIDAGHKHYDYYGMVLNPAPQYILKSIEVFKYPENIIAHSYSPEGKGKVAQYIIQDNLLDYLKYCTKKDFGRDYEKWKQWWTHDGQYLQYDKEKQVYR